MLSTGQQVAVSFTVANNGAVAALEDWTDAIYLSYDGLLDVTDPLLATRLAGAASPLAGGTSYQAVMTVEIPSTFTGPAWLIIRIDDGGDQDETDETNNIRLVPVEIRQPDLQVADVQLSTSAATLGQSVEVTWTVHNAGTGDAPADFSDAIYLSMDAVWDVTDVLLAERGAFDQVPLAAGSDYTVSQSVVLPSFSLGQRYLIVRTDKGNRQGESNETNNLGVASLALDAADLEVANLTTDPASLESGLEVTVHWDILNTGTGAAAADEFSDRIDVRNLATGQTIHTGWLLHEHVRIEPGGLLQAEYTFTLPDGAPGVGQIQITVYADDRLDAGPWGDLPEYNGAVSAETNNQASLTSESVMAPYPDLVVSDIAAPVEAVSGEMTGITWTVTNQGNRLAEGPWAWQVYLSDDAEAGDDVLYGTFLHDGDLAPGASVTMTEFIDLPLDLSGAWTVVIVVDSADAVFEEGPANNTSADDAPMVVRLAPMANLRVSEVLAPANPFSGQSTIIQWTVANVGTGSTGAGMWGDQVALSADSVWSSDDLILASVPNASYLDAGESYVNSATVTLPITVDGPYFFLVHTDAGDQVYEHLLDDDNVGAAGPVSIEPTPSSDLVVSAVHGPAAAFSANLAHVTWHVSNQGTATTPGHWYDGVYLSADTVLDGSDRFVGMAVHDGALDPGEGYNGAADVSLPADAQGDAWFIIVTDLGNYFFERGGESNNAGVAEAPTDVHLVAPDLVVVEVAATELRRGRANHGCDVLD